jgi:tetratricopeptide (TPR) repeat protein
LTARAQTGISRHLASFAMLTFFGSTLSRRVFSSLPPQLSRGGLALLILGTALLGGCGKPKEVSAVARAEAVHLATEAQTHALLRDYAKAEEALARAVELDPEVSVYWETLGMNRARNGDKTGARKAYKRSLEIEETSAKKTPADVEAQLRQIRPLLLLGRVDEARKLLEKIAKDHAQDARPRQLIEAGAIDTLLADSKFKDVML